MNALKQVIERETAAHRHDDLAVDHELLRSQRAERIDDFGEIARQRLPGLRLDGHIVAVAKDDRPEAIPLRLELPFPPFRDAIDAAGLHRRKGRAKGESHRECRMQNAE